MHDGMPYDRIQGQGQGHEPIQGSSIENLQSREVDRQSPMGLIFEAKDDGSDGDSWSYKSRKAPVKSSPPTNQRPGFLHAGCPSCRPTNSVKAWLFNWPGAIQLG